MNIITCPCRCSGASVFGWGGGGGGGTPTHFFQPEQKKLWQNLHNGVGIISMTDLWADKQKKKKIP